jgi:hypothetical protein
MMELLLLWPILGILGFALYCSNPNTRPKKWYLLMIAFCTHTFFGLIGLFYGFVCFSGRKYKPRGIRND